MSFLSPDDILAAALTASCAESVAPPRADISEPEKSDQRANLRDMLAEQCAAEPDRLPWPDDWFDGTDSAQVQACRDLWGAALIACIRTALGASGTTDSRPSALNVNLSSSWFRSKDFHTMCALAGLDGVACMDRLTDPDRLPEIIATFEGYAMVRRFRSKQDTSEGLHHGKA